MTKEKKGTPDTAPKKPGQDSPPGFIPKYPEGLADKLSGLMAPEEAKKPKHAPPTPIHPDDIAYKVTFLCAGAAQPVVFPRIGGANSLSITMACLGAALELQQIVAGFEVEDIKTGELIASVGLRDFIGKVAPRIAEATNQQIIHPSQLTPEQVASFTKQQQAGGKGILEL